jgi:hypothetical protein
MSQIDEREARISVMLTREELDALIHLADKEIRDHEDQAAALIRDGLRIHGYLRSDITPEFIIEKQR